MVTYTYGDSNWKDKLTAYNGTPISYDAIGNPTNDGTWTYTWEKGRQLKQMTSTGTTATFDYNADGLRVRKTVNNVVTNYILHGKNIVHLTQGSDSLHFYYDAQNRPAIVDFNGTLYRYIYNLQGDVLGLLDSSNNEVVRYTYDAWGKVLSVTGTLASTVGTIQPFRYRGYVYDVETGLYYLRSRYYNPEWGRFINADSIVERNLYCYCENEPVGRSDVNGFFSVDDICSTIIDVIDTIVPGSKKRAQKVMSGDVDWFDWLDYFTCGYASSVKGAVAPEKPLSLEHWSDSFNTVAPLVFIYSKYTFRTNKNTSFPISSSPYILPSNINDIHHIMLEKHQWSLIGADDWSSVSAAIEYVMENGQQRPYKDINVLFSTVYHGYVVEVNARPYFPVYLIVDAWVNSEVIP